MPTNRRLLRVFSIIAILAMMFSSIQSPSAYAQSGDGLKRQFSAGSGRVSFLGPDSGRALSASKALGTFLRPQDPAMALAKRFGSEFGLKDPERDLSEMKKKQNDDGRLTVRYQQNYQGIPVMGGELIVNTNENGDLYSMNGEVSPDLSLQTQPTIISAQARETALGAVAKWYEKNPKDFVASEPEIWIYDESLLQPSTRPVELVWRMEVTSVDNSLPVRELVLVNAQRGGISLHFNQVDTAWTADKVGTSPNPINPRINPLQDNDGSTFTHALTIGNPAAPGSGENTCLSTDQRGIARPVGTQCDIGAYEGSVPWVPSPLVNTYSANSSSSLPGTFLCNQTQQPCTINNANPHADAAHKYAIGTYNFYATQFNRDSIDNNGMVITSTVHYCDPNFGCPYANAFWSGEQMVYGDAYGFPLADDVVAHELTHGVTQYESNLFYYYQSGAINESFSDLWGEYYDQTNGQGNDAANVKWLMGEDISGLGALRNMSDPPSSGDPDRMSSTYYYEGADDNGGVHSNSGLNNKAVFLLVEGGTFNGKMVIALGWDKTAAIYYEVQTNLLSSGADYSDLYYALQQACTNLIGQKGITSADCTEVKDALDAVEMNSQPASNFNTDAPLCTVDTPVIAFADDLETGTSNWTFTNGYYTRWQYDSPYGPYAQSGEHSLYADDYPQTGYDNTTDARATLAAFVVPNNAYLHFAHAYDFETGYNYGDSTLYNYDGGVLEYSTNAGSTWNDGGNLMQYNGYTGTIFSDYINPLKGRSAFVGSSHGYISTRLNLASLAGQSVTFRWRMGLDDYVSAWGWWVDNIKVYTCGPVTTFGDVPLDHWAWRFIEGLYNAGVTSGCNTSPSLYCPDVTVTRDQMAVFLLRGKHGSGYAPPPVGATSGFNDVPINYWAAAWIKQLAAEGITGGCGNGNYCPSLAVTRDQMAVFLLRAKYGSSYSPPAVGVSTGFGDVPTDHWAAPWIKQLVIEGITAGCGSGNYCPELSVTRAQMAVFLVRTFNLP